jgi:Na+-driven multidrug efflux pump
MSSHVLRLSGFMIMGFLAMTLAQLVEAAYLGMVGRDELAAVAFTFPVVMAFNAATRGIGIGTGAVLARAIGQGDRDYAARLASHGLLLTLVFTMLGAIVLFWQAPALFRLLGAEGHVLELTVRYISIWCLGVPAFGLSMVGSGLMRSIGDPAFPGYVFAFRERMLSTAMTGFVQSARDIAHVGIPAGASNLIQPLSSAIITRLLAGFGTSVVAGYGVAARLDAVVTMVVIGISASAAPLVGQNWGARLYDRVDEALRLGYRYCLIWGVIAAVIMWLFGEFFASLISSDAEVIETATWYLYVVPISIGFMGMINIANASFNALSKPMPPLLLSLVRLFGVYIPLAVAASHWFGFIGIFVVAALVNVIFGIAGWSWNRYLIKSLRTRT